MYLFIERGVYVDERMGLQIKKRGRKTWRSDFLGGERNIIASFD